MPLNTLAVMCFSLMMILWLHRKIYDSLRPPRV